MYQPGARTILAKDKNSSWNVFYRKKGEILLIIFCQCYGYLKSIKSKRLITSIFGPSSGR